MTTSNPTIFRRDSPSQRTSPSGVGLPPELAAKTRGRVKWIAFAFIVMGLAGMGISVFFWSVGGISGAVFGEQVLGYVVVTTFPLVLWLIARGQRANDNTVLNLGLALEVVTCFAASFGTASWHYEAYGAPPFMTWSTPLIILFALIIPCPPRRMLVASIIAACSEPGNMLFMWFVNGIPREVGHLGVMINPIIAVVMAYFCSRVIFGLNVDVVKARRLGAYQLEERLGAGGMGEVWRASHRLLARPAAVKLVRSEALTEAPSTAAAVLRRFEQEAQATAGFRSPHTIQLYDFGTSADGHFYYVMELLDGVDLESLVKDHGAQPGERVAHLLIQACHSLEEAHRAGMVHRDIKPANLFVCRYGTDDDFLKVLDFGLVKEHAAPRSQESQLTQLGAVVGTPGFMAPEAVLGESEIDGRADLYALGCVAYWLLTGALVFEGETPMAVMVKHAREEPEPPSSRSEIPVPESLERIVLACLDKDPERRPRSAAELAEQLRECRFDEPWTADRARRWWEVNRPTTGAPA